MTMLRLSTIARFTGIPLKSMRRRLKRHATQITRTKGSPFEISSEVFETEYEQLAAEFRRARENGAPSSEVHTVAGLVVGRLNGQDRVEVACPFCMRAHVHGVRADHEVRKATCAGGRYRIVRGVE